jgi:hypothetical protein
MKTILLLSQLFFFVLVYHFDDSIAQHKIPIGTNGNIIELNIKNLSNPGSSRFVVIVSDLPEWIEFSNKSVEINKLNPGENAIANFHSI